MPGLLSSPPSKWRSLWSLDPHITFLNHGSFGACPQAVLEVQHRLRQQMESEPVRFFAVELEGLLDDARSDLAAFIGADPNDVVFVPNATTGVNTVLRSLGLKAGDELLTTSHEYNASRNALNVAAERSGATVVVADIPFPLDDPQQVIDAVLRGVSARTRLLLIDHVTSQTGMILPLQPIVQALAQQGIDTLVDGAHAPGMIALRLHDLGAAYYTGNCHKWLCAPKGAAFLYVRSDRRDGVRPLVISHGANSPRRVGIAPPAEARSLFHLEFDWVGTIDPTPYLCVPTAIRYMEALLPDGWSGIMHHNRALALAARQRLCGVLAVDAPCPESMIGSMAVVPLPDGPAELLQARLYEQFSIEIPVISWETAPHRLIRLSAQLYNTLADYDELAEAVVTLLAQNGMTA